MRLLDIALYVSPAVVEDSVCTVWYTPQWAWDARIPGGTAYETHG